MVCNDKKTNEKLEQIKSIVQDWSNKTTDTIKKNPVKSVLIAAGVGAAIGAVTVAILKRRK